ncbi:hypothetical protein LOK49_LG07G01595 [Camellia lanceoleosa]|uniref:Uncharacterized protein n=1 Tax=Camellia lanceoleosa TaxID=1840588 RepID=A0ACC0H7C1_9ERIC|nr:hypothetical protein LOK49_LG07G01595 [Camellia lanceoleosa]
MTINLIFVHHMQNQHHYELMQVMILEKTSMPPLDMLAKRVKTTARECLKMPAKRMPMAELFLVVALRILTL